MKDYRWLDVLIWVGILVTLGYLLFGCSMVFPKYVYCQGKGNIAIGPYAGQVDCGPGVIISSTPPPKTVTP